MPKFTFERIKAIGIGQYKVLQLDIDGVKQFDKFIKELKGTDYEEEYQIFLGWLEHYTQTGEIGFNKLKELKKNKKDPIKEFEFRTTNLRMYAVQGDTGKIIILCGYKKDQVRDLSSFRSLKKRIFQQK